MIEITDTEVFGIRGAMDAMRMPFESHKLSDSYDDLLGTFTIGPRDMELAQKLISSGAEHRTFIRQIHVQCKVKGPRYWWQEFDKYKFVDKVSSSTMHLLGKRRLTIEDFSYDNLEDSSKASLMKIIGSINDYIDSHERPDIKVLKKLLPESYNQVRRVDLNYETLLSMYHQRGRHRLTEWKEFCKWIEELPYMSSFLKSLKEPL